MPKHKQPAAPNANRLRRLLRQALSYLRQFIGSEGRFPVAAGADHKRGEPNHRRSAPWAVRIRQVPPPAPSPVHAAVLNFCWRRPVLRKLLLGSLHALAKLNYLLRELAELIIFPARISLGHLRLLQSQLDALAQDASGLGVAQRGDQGAQRGK